MATQQFSTITPPIIQETSYEVAIKENPNNIGTNDQPGQHTRYWQPGRTLRVSFTQALSDELKFRTERIIREWEPYVSLAFEFVDNPLGDIRIALQGKSSYSTIGTDALMVSPDKPTLVVGTDKPTLKFRKTLLHEFGHALGLLHMHLHPDANIPWNRQAVYDHYQSKGMLNRQAIDNELFNSDIATDTNLIGYDTKSIMHYPVDNRLTEGDWELGLNTELSELDKIHIRKIYPAL